MWLDITNMSGHQAVCADESCRGSHRQYWGTLTPFNPEVPCVHIPVSEEIDGTRYARVRLANLCDCGCGVVILRPYLTPMPNAAGPNRSNMRGLCEYCLTTPLLSTMEMFEDDNGPMLFCRDCYSSRVQACSDCGERHLTGNLYHILRVGAVSESGACSDCYNQYEQCSHCRRYNHEENDPCCEDIDEDDCTCYDCRRARQNDRGPIRNYSYKPDPVFHAVGDEIKYRVHPEYRNRYDATPYMGFELEVEVPSALRRSKVASTIQGGLGDVAYLKEDGSINHGFEIVTHPMTLDYAMTKLNWKTLREARRAGNLETSSNCGLHVHVSKAGFSGPAHEYRWLLFWHRNQSVMIQLAGRDSSYARYIREQRPMFRRVVERKPASMERYSAINTINDATYEVRVFASTLFINRLKASLQLVDATVEYTRNLAASKVMHDGGFSWSEFVVWLRRNARRYPDLITRIRDVVKVDAPEVVKIDTSIPVIDSYGYREGWISRDIVIQEKVSA